MTSGPRNDVPAQHVMSLNAELSGVEELAALCLYLSE